MAHCIIIGAGPGLGQAIARRFGAEPREPGERTPMGIAKIPFAGGGAIALPAHDVASSGRAHGVRRSMRTRVL